MSTILANKVSTLKTGRPLKKEAPSGKERPPWRSRPIRNFLAPPRRIHSFNDGQRFLLRPPGSGETAPSLTVVLNWQTQLKK